MRLLLQWSKWKPFVISYPLLFLRDRSCTKWMCATHSFMGISMRRFTWNLLQDFGHLSPILFASSENLFVGSDKHLASGSSSLPPPYMIMVFASAPLIIPYLSTNMVISSWWFLSMSMIWCSQEAFLNNAKLSKSTCISTSVITHKKIGIITKSWSSCGLLGWWKSGLGMPKHKKELAKPPSKKKKSV